MVHQPTVAAHAATIRHIPSRVRTPAGLRPSLLGLALAAAFASQAQTNPTGGIAIHGQASFSNPAANQLVVTTQNGVGTGHSAINWQSFSIAPGASTTFVQPSATSTAINRVVTNTPSAIFGTLSSNGRLVLVNQSGITVGAGAVVDTAGFTASALRMTEADALAGRLRFGDPGASMGGAAGITVGGRITARDGDVVLIAPNIEMGASALVQAPNGSAVLAAGQQVEITGRGLEGITMLVQARENEARNLGRLEGDAVGIFAGTLRHSGEIQATTATLEGGRVVLKASGDAYVEGAGRVIATGARGGQVDVLGERVAVADQALVDVSGASGGGTIRIGGDYQGGNPDIKNADKAYLGGSAVLRADAIETGDGGRVIVWSNDHTQAFGSISARGGAQRGDGGFVEVSGKHSLSFAAQVDTRAAHGQTGTLLLDPDFINVDASGTAYAGDVLFGAGTGLLTLDVATINTSLTNVMLQANEDINFNASVSMQNAGIGLTARAGGFLTTTGSITTKGGIVELTAGHAGSLTSPSEGALNLNGAIDTTGGGTVPSGASVTLTSNLSDVSGNSLSINAGINAGTSTVTLDTLAGIGSMDLVGGTLISGNLNLNSGFNVTQTGGSILASGVTTLNASNVSLTQPGNNFASFGGVANSVSVTDLNGIVLGASSFSLLTVNAGGNVSQSAAVGVGGTTTINAGSGNVTLNNAGNNLSQLVVSGNALDIVAGGGVALTVQSLTSGIDQPVRLEAGNNLILPSSTIDTGAANLTLVSGNVLTAPGALGGNNISLSAVNGINISAMVAATGTFIATTSGGTSVVNVRNAVTSGGAMTLTLAGGLVVADDNFSSATLESSGGQTISAKYVAVRSANFAPALIKNTGGTQDIHTTGQNGSGEGVLVQSTGFSGGALASIENAGGGSQIVTVDNADFLHVVGELGDALIGSDGSQTIVVQGAGQNTIKIGSASAAGESKILAASGQSITAGQVGQLGGIVLVGGTSDGLASAIVNLGGTQTISTTGTISLTAGSASGAAELPDQCILFGLGACAYIEADGGGDQTITAGGIIATGGSVGSFNAAGIVANGGGSQTQTITINGGGSIALVGGSSDGDHNLAVIEVEGANQTITFSAGGALTLTGGTVGTSNFAEINTFDILDTGGLQSISGATAITLTGGASGGGIGAGNAANITSATSQSISVGSGGLTLTGGGGALAGNSASIAQDGAAGTSQTITVTGGGSISLTGGSTAMTGVGEQDGSRASIRTDFGDSQTVTVTGGGSISLTGGTVGSDAYAEIYAGLGTQTITGASLITLTGGASGGGPSFTGNDSTGNVAGFSADTNHQTIVADGIVLQGGATGQNNLAAIYGGGNQSITVGAGGLQLIGGSGGENDVKNAAIVIKGNDVAGTSQTITVGGGGSIVLQGGNASATNVGSDANLLDLSNGAFASIRSDGIAQLIEFTGSGGSITMTGGTVGSNNLASLIATTGTQTIRGTSAANAPAITLQGGASGGLAGEGNRAVIAADTGTQSVTASSIAMTGGAAGTENLAQIRQGDITTGLAETQTVAIAGGGNLSITGGGGTTNLARIRSYGVTQTVDLGAGGTLDITGGTGASNSFARIVAENGDQLITGSGAITITGGASGGAVGNGNFADIRQRNVAGVQSVSGSALTIKAGAGGVENSGGIRGDGSQTVSLQSAGSNALVIGDAASAFSSYITGNNQVVTAGSGAQSGSITIRGGTGAGLPAGIFNNTGTQTVSTTGTLSLTGGSATGTLSSCSATGGSCADIVNSGTGLQTITANTILLQGGSTGVSNGAGIFVNGGDMQLNAGAGGLMLTTGTGTSDNFATIGGSGANGSILTINVAGNTVLDGQNATNGSGALIGMGGTATGSTVTIDFNGTGNLTIFGSNVASLLAGSGIGTGSNQTNATATITVDAANIALNAGTQSVARIGHRAGNNGAGDISLTATGNIAFNTSGSPEAAVRTSGNVTLSAGGSITEGPSGAMVASLLTASAVSGINLDSQNNQITSLFATNTTSGDITIANQPSALLTVTGMSQFSGGTIIIGADDLDITGAVSAPNGAVSLRPVDLTRAVLIEAANSGGGLSLSPSDLAQVSTGVLQLGRLDGSGNLNLLANLGNTDVSAGTLLLLSGADITLSGGTVGLAGTAFDHSLEIRAANNLLLSNGGVFLADNRSLKAYADNDGSNVGNVNIGAGTLRVGTGAGNTTGLMDIKGSTVTVDISGGSGTIEVLGSGSQTFTSTIGDIDFWNSNSGANQNLIITSGTGVQTFAASGLLSLKAGTGSVTSVITGTSGGSQVVNAAILEVIGGSTGTGNEARLYANGNQSVTVGNGGITIQAGSGSGGGNLAAIGQLSVGGSQSVNTFGDITLTGGAGPGANNQALLLNNGSGGQTVTLSAGGVLSLQAGAGGSGNRANINSASGNQNVTGAGTITLTAGASGGGIGVGNTATINLGGGGSVGNQTVSAGSGGITLLGGGGTGSDTDNAAFITYGGAGSQSVSITGGGSLTLVGGSSALQNVGGAGHGSRAGIDAGTVAGTVQTITLDGGDISLTGGTLGSRAQAGIFADAGSQTITGATNIYLDGGASGGVGGEGNRAVINAGVNQTVSATNISLTGGANGADNYARIGVFGAGALSQTITANSILLDGGADGGGFGTGNYAAIKGTGSQLINVGAGGLALFGGGGSLSDNAAQIEQIGTVGTQTINITGSGLVMQGGSSAGTNVGGTGHGSRASIYSEGTAQTLNFLGGGGFISMTGGTTGSRNFAQIFAENTGNQFITGAPFISLTGGDSGGVAGEGNSAFIATRAGSQSITASGLILDGGAGGTDNLAAVDQGIAANANTQLLTLSPGASVNLQGGSGDGNFARIKSFGSAQTLGFGAGNSLDLLGGTGASGNFAMLQSVDGVQTIGGNPDIALTGGASGGSDIQGNFASIAAGLGSQTILANTLALQAGAGGTANYAVVTALTQDITTLGDMSLTGGGSSPTTDGQTGGGARVGAGGSTNPTNLTLGVGGNLTLTGGSLSGASLGSNRVGTQVTNLDITVGGNLALVAGSNPAAGVRLGSPAAGLAGGTISVTAASGDISLSGGTAGETAIRTLGDVTLDAATLTLNNSVIGSTITATGASSVAIGGVGSLTASAASGDAIRVVSGGTFSNTAGSGALGTSLPARWLVYSVDPALDTRGALAYDFKQYGKTFGDATAILGSGNGFLYSTAPTATVSLTGAVSKTYDGTTTATIAPANLLAAGAIDGDVLTASSPASGTYDTRNAGTGKTVSVSGVTVSALDGTKPVYGYGVAGGAATGAVGTITKANLTVSTSAVNKAYDGTTSAAGTAIVTGGSLFGSDALSGGSFAFVDKNVGVGKTVTASGVAVNDGNAGGNYSVTYASNLTSSISALALSTWSGSADSLWSNPANWVNGAIPDGTNVLSVAIPAGTGSVVFDAAAGPTSLQSLSSQRPVSVTGGNLQIGTSLLTSDYSQSGGAVSGAGTMTVAGAFSQTGGTIALGGISIAQNSGNLVFSGLAAPTVVLAAPAGSISQTGPLTSASLATSSLTGTNLTNTGNQVGVLVASNAGGGDIRFANTGVLTIAGMSNAQGNIDVTNTGAIASVGPITTPGGNVTITANSPLTIGAGGVTAGGSIVLNAGNIQSPGPTDNLTLDGPLTAGSTVDLSAGNSLVQNSAVLGTTGVSAAAGTSVTYGPLATANNAPVLYTVAGVTVAPPPTVLAGSLQPTASGDILVTFLDLFQQALDMQSDEVFETNPDGTRKKKDGGDIVTEGEICR